MELIFNKTNNGYIADYVATTHFNLHIEGGGRVMLYKRTSGEGWSLYKSFLSGASVIDIDEVNDFKREYLLCLEDKPTMCVLTYADGTIEEAVMA